MESQYLQNSNEYLCRIKINVVEVSLGMQTVAWF